MKFSRILFLLLTVCLLVRVAFILHFPLNDFFYPDGYDYSRIATGIMKGEGFYPSGMEPIMAYRAPLYPFILAGIYRVAGHENLVAVRTVHCLLALATALLFFGIARRLGGTLAGLLAAAFFAIHPFFIYYCRALAPETFFIFLTVLTYDFLFRFFSDEKVRWLFLAGVSLGCAALTKGTVLLITPAAFLTVLFILRKMWKRAWGTGILLGMITFLTISPLTVWVYQRWHEFSLILDGAGLNFWIANSDESVELFHQTTSQGFQSAQKHLWLDVLPGHDRQIRTLGPASRDAYYFHEGAKKFKENPARSLWMMTERFKIFWRPWVHPLAYSWKEVILSGLATVPLFLLGFFQLFRRLRQRHPDAIFMALALIPITLITGMLFNTEIRWRIPLVDSLLIVYSALTLAQIMQRSEGSIEEAT